MHIETTFWIGDYVHVDDDTTLKMRVVAIELVDLTTEHYKLSWVRPSGDFAEEWFPGWRLTPAKE
jgi:hypothetical protein